MKRIIYIMTVALLAVLVGAAIGREWSREIRMTDDQDDWNLSADWFHAAVDGNDDIHVTYTAYNANVDSILPWQPIYQKFNRYGEPLMDPLIFAQITDTLDYASVAYDMCLDEEDNVHILWGSGVPYHTMISNDGEIVIRDAMLQGILLKGGRQGGFNGDDIKMAIENEQILVFGGAIDRINPDRAVFGRYEYNGELIDTLVIIDTVPLSSPRFKLTHDGIKHFMWYGRHNVNWYARMDADDSLVVLPTRLEVPHDDDDNNFLYTRSDFDIDEEGGLWINTPQEYGGYLMRYNADLSVDLGNTVFRNGKQCSKWNDLSRRTRPYS